MPGKNFPFNPFLAIILAAPVLLVAQGSPPRALAVQAGRSLVLDSPADMTRVSVADPDIVEAVGVTPREVVLNGRKAGTTSVILWQKDGGRVLLDVSVSGLPDRRKLAIERELNREFGEGKISVDTEGDMVFLRGIVDDLTAADRAESMASALGKPVNLLQVSVPTVEPQILLKVRFADLDRVEVQRLGMNLFSTGTANTVGAVSTGQFAPLSAAPGGGPGAPAFNLSDLLNVFLFRPDLNLGATIRLLQEKRILEMLAEPNVLAMNGRDASFLAGGEYPYPVVQGGGGIGIPFVTLRFREFGIRLNFRPTISPRGTIKLVVEPEVSALDFVNGLVFQGFNIPGLLVRRVSTEIELEDRQSFAIAGLLDNRTTEALAKVPGLGDIPWLGKLFRSRAIERDKSELLVLVTPEIVRPIPAGQPLPGIEFPLPFIKDGAATPPRTPGMEVTGTAQPGAGSTRTIPVEVLREEIKREREEREKARTAAMGSGAGSERGTSRSRYQQ